jgi:glycosyltransferase involved in cell wall biosynthesis
VNDGVDGVDGVVRLVFVGHLERGKRPERFVDVVRALRSEGLSVEASIAGDGPLLTAVRSLGRDAGVEVLGNVDDVPALLARSDVLVFTSSPAEGMPGVLIEAGMAALPVVTTDVPGARDIVEHERTGFVVAVDDLEGLIGCTRALVDDPELRARLGDAARIRCGANFSLEASARRWQTLVAEMTAGLCTSST